MEEKIWVVSDWHFNHDKEFVWKARGFSSVQEMNEAIIERHNSVVSPNDIVYILGDCCLSDKLEENKVLISRMNGQKYFILGNHCTSKRAKMYEELGTVLGYAWMVKYKKYNFYLSHYSTLCSNYDDDKPLKTKVINLCGHTHTTDHLADIDKGLIYHCEMDAHSCYPVLLDDIIKVMKMANQKFAYCPEDEACGNVH